jgi:hypothetical protein
MKNMRLYTEENVIEMVWMFAPLVGRTAILVELNSLRHIEIPSDEEIEKYVESTPYYGYCTTEFKEGIEDGAKWVINLIKQQDNGK